VDHFSSGEWINFRAARSTTFGGTRDEKAVGVMRQRINAFGLLLGGVPSLDDDDDTGDSEQSFAEAVLRGARKDLASLNRRLRV
jgi:hypothetical protein